LLSKSPQLALKILVNDQMYMAICNNFSFYEYTADLSGLPENLNANESIIIMTNRGTAKLSMISSIVNADALMEELRYSTIIVTYENRSDKPIRVMKYLPFPLKTDLKMFACPS
jgi:hypothetical protein